MRIWIPVALALVAAFLGLSAWLFGFPRENVPRRADAVVVLAGNWEVRLPVGQRLVEEGVAPVLALSEDSDDDWPRGLCRDAEVVCFQADPYSTYGEAQSLGEVAARRGWESVVVVTSDYHLTRAHLLVGRCLDSDVGAAAAEEPLADWLHGAFWEWPKLLHALTLKRDC